jgi:hypothetical protein
VLESVNIGQSLLDVYLLDGELVLPPRKKGFGVEFVAPYKLLRRKTCALL